MKVYLVTIKGYWKGDRKPSVAYRAIVRADTEEEAKKAIFTESQYMDIWLKRVLEENPKLHLDAKEITEKVYILKMGK